MNICKDSCDDTDSIDPRVMALEKELKRVKHERDHFESELEHERNGEQARLLNAIRRIKDGGRMKSWYVDDDGCIESDRHEIWIGFEGDILVKDRYDGNVVSIDAEALPFLVIIQCARANIGLDWICSDKSDETQLELGRRLLPEYTFIETDDNLEIHCACARPGYQEISAVSAKIELKLLYIWELHSGSTTVSDKHMSAGPHPNWPSDTLVTSGARQVIVPTAYLMDKVQSIKARRYSVVKDGELSG